MVVQPSADQRNKKNIPPGGYTGYTVAVGETVILPM